MMEMMNLDNFGNPFMAFQQKFDDSAEEDEIEDDDDLEGRMQVSVHHD